MRYIRTIHTYNGDGDYHPNILQSEYVDSSGKVEWWQIRTDGIVSSSIMDKEQGNYHCWYPSWIEVA